MDMADVITFVCDGKEGRRPRIGNRGDDLASAAQTAFLRQQNRQMGHAFYASCFTELNLGDPIAVSAEHSVGLGDLLDEVVRSLSREKLARKGPPPYKIAVVGNRTREIDAPSHAVGDNRVSSAKSTGTTRDAIDTRLLLRARPIGYRPAGIKEKQVVLVDRLSSRPSRAAKAIDRADICLMMIDRRKASRIRTQRSRGPIKEAQKPLWYRRNNGDLVEKESNTKAQMEKMAQKRF